jgi:hypothetical protein
MGQLRAGAASRNADASRVKFRSHNLLAVIALAGVLAGCAKPAATTQSAATAVPTAASVSLAVPTSGPHNSLVADIGKPGSVPLDAASKAEIARTAAAADPDRRKRLRYAIAPDSAGKGHLVIYDGLDLPPNGKPPGKKFEYIVFKALNATDGSTYDPSQNTYEEAVPPPKERDSTVTFH